MIGTNFYTPLSSTVDVALANLAGDAMLIRCTAANLPTGAGYAVGCIATATDSGAFYTNTGTNTVASFALISASSVTLPSALTDASSTTGSSLALTANSVTSGKGINLSVTGLTSGTGVLVTAATAALTTGGSLFKGDMVAATAGNGLTIATTGAYTGTGLAILTAGAMTTGVGLQITSTTGLTSGSLLNVTSSTAGAIATNGAVSVSATGAFTSASNVGFFNILANTTTAGTVASIFGNGLTTGQALYISGTAAYTGTGFAQIIQNGATTGTILNISNTALTSGKGIVVTAAAATLTTGRYLSMNDGALEVFGIGADGHIHTSQTTAPTIVVTTQNGITAAALTAGASDTCGIITTTGTSTAATVLDVTFNKTYTTAPKSVIIAPANAAANMPNTSYYVSAISATGFTITVPAGGTYAATPSWRYIVIA